jgi:Outer membrane protein beta-barrel domain
MSDFDKRLSNMMNEEEHSPNMQQNWERLSTRLQPTQPLKMVSPHKRWFVGIAASVGVLALSAMSYFLLKTNKENEALKKEVTILKNKTQSIDNKTITYKDNILIKKNNNIESGSENTLSSKQNLEENKAFDNILSENKADKNVSGNSVLPQKTNVEGNKNSVEKTIQTPLQAKIAVTQNNGIEKRDPSVFSNKKEITINKEAVKKENIVQNVSQSPADLTNNTPIITAEKEQKNLNTIVENKLENTTIALDKNIKNIDFTALPLTVTQKKTASLTPNIPLSMEGVLMQSPVMIRSTPRTKRFAIGVQAFASVGENEERESRGPALNGLGLIASYNLTRNFELMASVDLGGMRYDFKEGPKGNRIPKEPRDKPKDHPRLKGVSGKQDRQQFSIGLKYKLPLNTILIPSLSVGYDLQRLGKQDCRFDFVNDTTNTEVAVQQVVEPQISKNLWHLGAGVEANVYSFNLSLSAQYQKDFSINNDNRIILRAGVKYRF